MESTSCFPANSIIISSTSCQISAFMAYMRVLIVEHPRAQSLTRKLNHFWGTVPIMHLLLCSRKLLHLTGAGMSLQLEMVFQAQPSIKILVL